MLDVLGEANAAALIGLLGGMVLGLAARWGVFAHSARLKICSMEAMIAECACGSSPSE